MNSGNLLSDNAEDNPEPSRYMQNCTLCKVTKPLSDFGPALSRNSVCFNANNTPLLKKQCRICLADQARKWRAANKGYDGTGRFAQHKSERLLVSAICTRVQQARANNKRSNRAFNLTMEYMLDLWRQQGGRCRYTNQELFIEKDHPATLSIDKIEPEKGYVEGNVQLVAWAVNRAKGDLEEAVFIQMCKAVAKGATTIPSGSTPQAIGGGSAEPLALS